MKDAILMATAILSAAAAFADKLENGASYSLNALPAELVAQAPEGQSVRFSLEENSTTGYSWEMEHNASECDVAMVRKSADSGLAGAPGQVMVEVQSKVQTPARVEFRYRRPWGKDAKPAHARGDSEGHGLCSFLPRLHAKSQKVTTPPSGSGCNVSVTTLLNLRMTSLHRA